jgi:subtilase family serine protease
MVRKFCLAAVLVAIGLSAGVRVPGIFAKNGRATPVRDLITQEIDESRRVTLHGNTRPEARPERDRGRVPDDFRLEHMLLQLRRPPETEQEFETYIDSLTQNASANYHQWLTPAQVGENYGLSESDLRTIEDWLQKHDITVNYVYPNRVVMDISGTARALREAMNVEIHYLDVDGEKHYANMNDPEIPEALATAIVGIVSMHDFRPNAMARPRPQLVYTDASGTYEAVTPSDLAAIYNFNPLFSQGITGTGQTVVVVEDSDPYTPSGGTTSTDWTSFTTEFGLTKYGGTLSVVQPNPTGSTSCTDPGDDTDDSEVAVDIDSVAAAAPGAAIEVATCSDTTTYGPLIAVENISAQTPHPYIVSVSYGVCEADNLAAANAAFNSAYQTAASEGISVFVAAGDEGASSCDPNAKTASHGINVSGWASTPYNVAVGGTDFGDTVTGTTTMYWNSTNSSTFQNAKGYIPEIPWNDSCAGYLLANYEGQNPPYGSTGYCNNGGTAFRTTGAGSGGPSECATGAPATGGEVGGTCAGYAKPSWQSGLFGNPNDGVRDLPDVSLFASNGLWGHFYIICYSHVIANNGGHPCTPGTPDPTAASGATWSAFGGTSFGTPILAAIQALVNQRTAALTITPVAGEGNPNPVYYAIAASEYGSTGSSLCNSSTQGIARRGVATTCVFYDVTQGDIDVNCTRNTPNCYDPGATGGNHWNGTLSTGTISGLTFVAGTAYTSAPTCTISAPHNQSVYNGDAGGTQATCTATINGTGHVSAVNLTNAGTGYAPDPTCTLTGGGGTGATCTVSGITNNVGYEPGFPTTAGWDFATGIGTVNAYNLVFSGQWHQGP